MDVLAFLRQVAYSFNPVTYQRIADLPSGRMFLYTTKVLVLGMVLSVALFVPLMFQLPSLVAKELSAIETITGSATVEMSRPIEFPRSNPQIIIDTSGTVTTLKHERVLVTQDSLYFKLFNKLKRVQFQNLSNVSGYQGEAVWALVAFILFLLPSMVVFGFLLFFMKYVIIAGITGMFLFFLIRFLLLFKVSFSKTVNVVLYASTAMILCELIFLPIAPSLMLPVFGIFGFSFYAIPFGLFFILACFGIALQEVDHGSEFS